MFLYHFPPVGGVSVSRNVRNVQYLPIHGWDPIVVAPHSSANGLSDTSMLNLIPDATRVVRTRSPEAGDARGIVVRIRRLARRRLLPGRSNVERHRATALPASQAVPLKLGWLRRLLFFPDDQIGWLPFAMLATYRIHRQFDVDAIYSTSSPVTAHLVAGLAKRLTGAPWIVEFRDPWIGNPLAPRLPWLHRRLQSRLEGWIVNTADRVVCVTPSMTRMYQRRYPGAAVETISNGYDRSEVVPRSSRRGRDRRFRIVYTGTLDRPPELRVLLDGLETLKLQRPQLSDRLEIVFYGAVSPGCRAIVEARSSGSLGSTLRFEGFVPRELAMQALADADAALVLLGKGPGMEVFVGGKLYDYLGQNRQILAVLPPGDARDVLTGLDWGVVAEPEASSIADALERLISLPEPDRAADPAGIYDRAVLAERLAACLTAASEMPGRRKVARS